jgi:energy-coupling factor transport system ATP-binding protein
VSEPLARAEALSYRYPGAASAALVDLDLELVPGELVVLAGRSGAGKTTLLRACCGLVPHYYGGEVSGSLEVGGLDVREHGPAELGASVGLVAQDPETQVVSTTVRAEIELPLEMRGHSPAARARAVEEVALALAIPQLLDRTADTLSGGELQRVALAAALVGRPRLVLLDEPTSQLDPVAGEELIALLRRLNEQWGTAVVLAEHRLERCLAAADRVIAVDRGRIGFDGAPGAFLDWALRRDRVLATPGAQLFDLAGLRPPPPSVKAARARLARRVADLTARASDVVAVDAAVPAGSGAQRGPAAQTKASGRRSDAAALEIRGLWLALDAGDEPREVLRGIDLRVERGERVALMGRNGAGKTTLLRTAAGLIAPSRGRVATPRGSALCPQAPGDLLVRERTGDELPGERGRAALAGVGLGWALDRDPRDLSGGERQRLALAIVMAGRGGVDQPPGLVCLDEPTRGMDRARKDDLATWTGELAERGAGVVIATHDVEFAAAFADRVVLLGSGEVIAAGEVAEILSGGWYFATEVARILGASGAISPVQGAALLRQRLAPNAEAVR